MKINLRRAKALQTAIYEKIQTLPIALAVDINEFDNAEAVLKTASKSLDENLKARQALWTEYYNLRAKVSMLNCAKGIDALLAQQALTEQLIREIQPLTTISNSVKSKSLAVITSQQDKLRTTSNAFQVDHINTGVLSEAAIKEANIQLTELRRTKQKINDSLLDLNVKTEINLDELTVNTLTTHGLI